MIPAQYKFLTKEKAPRMLLEALALYGVTETPGPKNSAEIMSWADEADVPYPNDDVAWCGLFMAIVALRAGKPIVANPLWARNWAKWGKESPYPMLGDVLVFSRPGGGGHVALYVGEDKDCYHVLGGNQSDMVNITRVKKDRLLAARQLYEVGRPDNCRTIAIKAVSAISKNEA